VAVEEEVVYTTSNRDPMTTPKARSLRASVHGFYSKDGFFNFKGSGTYLIRYPLMRRFKFTYLPTTGYTLRVPNDIQLGSTYELHAWWSRHLEDLTEYRWTNCEPHGTASTGVTFDYSFASAMKMITTARGCDVSSDEYYGDNDDTDVYGIATNGFVDENDDGITDTVDERGRVLSTTFASTALITRLVVAATSSFDSIVAVVALIATIFGIYELSAICASTVVAASSYLPPWLYQSEVGIYLWLMRFNLFDCLLLTAVVVAITLTVVSLFLRRYVRLWRCSPTQCPTGCSRAHLPATLADTTFWLGPMLRQGALDTPTGGGDGVDGALSDDEELDNYYSNGALRPAVPRRRTAAELNGEMSPLPDDEDLNNYYLNGALLPGYGNYYEPMTYRSWYITEHDYSPEPTVSSPASSPTPDDRAAARRRNEYSPVSDVDEGEPDQVADPPPSQSEPDESDDDEICIARYPTAAQILRDGQCATVTPWVSSLTTKTKTRRKRRSYKSRRHEAFELLDALLSAVFSISLCCSC
jgi:hypothetical protein